MLKRPIHQQFVLINKSKNIDNNVILKYKHFKIILNNHKCNNMAIKSPVHGNLIVVHNIFDITMIKIEIFFLSKIHHGNQDYRVKIIGRGY